MMNYLLGQLPMSLDIYSGKKITHLFSTSQIDNYQHLFLTSNRQNVHRISVVTYSVHSYLTAQIYKLCFEICNEHLNNIFSICRHRFSGPYRACH